MPGLVLMAASSVLAGCATTKAATTDAGPPLAVPVAPQRVIVPAEEEPLASTSTGLDRPLASVPQVQQQQPPPTTTRRQSPPRAENENRNEAAASSATATAAGTTPEPARDSRAVAAENASRKEVQALLTKVSSDLKCVDRSKLSSERKTILDDITRHVDLANEKLAERNYLVAQAAAEKAAAFAADLATTCPR